MCGIVAYKGDDKCLPFLFEGLKRLEYRGYDSAGITYVVNHSLITNKQAGCVQDLKNSFSNLQISTYAGMGHTRWATHGSPCARNAHPHITSDHRVALVHNGIIENYLTLKQELLEKEYKFLSDTDSEVFLYLIYDYLVKEASDIYEAVKLASERVVGAFAIVVIDGLHPEKMVCARRGSPLVIGVKGRDYYVASDALALSGYVDDVIYMEENSVCCIGDKLDCYNLDNKVISYCNIQKLHYQLFDIEKGDYAHFMLKEIHEQPRCIEDCISGRLDGYRIKLGGLLGFEEVLSSAEHITIVGCGTSWHAGLLAKYYLEEFCRIKVGVEYASEFRYRKPTINKGDIVIGISQSGETADTLGALELAKEKGAVVIGICNAVNSSMPRLSDCGIFLRAGMEIGVASTKAFTSQVVCLLMLALWIEQHKEHPTMDIEYRKAIIDGLRQLPDRMRECLCDTDSVSKLAKKFNKAKNCLYLGRQYNFPVALEGALKLKEISYVHAEGYPAAEMKHGPIALIDKNMPVIVIANHRNYFDKIYSNIEEIKAREGKIITICNEKSNASDYHIIVPPIIDPLSPLVSIIPLQLFSYYSAVLRGCDVDKPRNLAKSVTVE
jgi:glucosamine--fructose-6-phosphate aminotransferase (isomerizing)